MPILILNMFSYPNVIAISPISIWNVILCGHEFMSSIWQDSGGSNPERRSIYLLCVPVFELQPFPSLYHYHIYFLNPPHPPTPFLLCGFLLSCGARFRFGFGLLHFRFILGDSLTLVLHPPVLEPDLLQQGGGGLFISLRPMHRVITPGGAKPGRLLLIWNLSHTFFGSRHCTCAYVSCFKEEGWKYFCRFVFV